MTEILPSVLLVSHYPTPTSYPCRQGIQFLAPPFPSVIIFQVNIWFLVDCFLQFGGFFLSSSNVTLQHVN